MARLTASQKAYIIQRVACFDAPSVVVQAVKEDLGIDVSRQLVETHDPKKAAGKTLAKKWVKLFEEARAAFLADTADIATSHKQVRIRRLQRMADKAEEMKNYALASTILEQIAKEMGDAYTNKRLVDLSNPDGTLKPEPAITINSKDVAEAVKALTG